eukprot:jgi/Chrzof1/4401/Cz14g11220.t1
MQKHRRNEHVCYDRTVCPTSNLRRVTNRRSITLCHSGAPEAFMPDAALLLSMFYAVQVEIDMADRQ